MTNSIEEILEAEVIFVIGSNTTENHPVIGTRMKQAKLRGAKLVVADPRKIELSNDADVFLQIKPGTNIALLNGMMNDIIEAGLEDKEYIASKTENYEEFIKTIKEYTPEKVAGICGVDSEDIKKAARIYAEADKAGIFYAMGITQHTTGTDSVISISNLALLCGNIGKESAGVNPLRGQNNVQGACDMGGLPGDLSGYQKVNQPKVREKFEKAWNAQLPSTVGLTIPEMLDSAVHGSIKFLYIMGENPMVSDPDIHHVRKALDNIDFLVVQDIFMTETAEMADVILPAAVFAEKDGTFTNTERRVQRVRKAIETVGEAKPDWMILMELMNRLGYTKKYNTPAEIMEEIAFVTPQYGGITYDKIDNTGIQWPCPTAEHRGTKFLHEGGCARGKGLFKPIEFRESAELTDDDFPFILTTGRVLYHYHTRTMTGKIDGLNKLSPESYIEINPTTAKKLGVNDKELVKVVSRRGKIKTRIKVTDRINKDVVFMPFHFAEGAVNYLTNTAMDKVAKIPELKVCAVNILKINY